jgi:hypothetical protein
MKFVGLVLLGLAVATVVARRRGYSGLGGNTIVRCRKGHLFSTIWIPGASLKAVRLGWLRFQYCPVGDHWTLVRPVKDQDLSEDQRQEAVAHHDNRIF